jgi:hypothetical protein
MPIQARDREFRFPRISYLDFKFLEMDRVLTSFFARVWHNGYPSRIRRNFELTIDAIVAEFLEHPEWFGGFQKYPDVTRRWVETHLMDVVNRGKGDAQKVAAPRPLHGFTYRFRNVKHSRPYGADEHLYEMLFHAREGRGIRALEHLKAFFFLNVDPATHQSTGEATVDVETQAILRLMDQVKEDAPDTAKGRESYPPLCVGACDLLADDILRLLFYQRFIPRSVLVDYLKILLSFHLALYHLRLLKMIPSLVRRKAADLACGAGACGTQAQNSSTAQKDCPYRVGIFADLVNRPGTATAALAERSADVWYRRIPPFIKAYFTVKKLDEFAGQLVKHGKLTRPQGGFTVSDLLPLLESLYKEEREPYFKMRLAAVLEDTSGDSEDVAPDIQHLLDMGLPAFDTYVELLVSHRGDFHRKYLVECIDSLLMKNRAGAVIAQPRTKNAPRRFVVDSRLLEVLLQVAVLRPGGALGFYTAPLRVDEFLSFLRDRYGIYIGQLPPGDGFAEATLSERSALRANLSAFTSRLREVGFYQDLSDAYVTQTVTPRYNIAEVGAEPEGANR